MEKLVVRISAFLFIVIALVHLARLIWKFDVVIAGTTLPLWANGLGFLMTFLLAVGLFKIQRKL